MKATITLLGRATAAEDFVSLWTGTAEVGASTASVTPAVPAEAAEGELDAAPRLERSNAMYAIRAG